MTFDLAIFDCDGTLVDSEVIHNRVISVIMTGMGYPRFDLDYALAHFAGKGMHDVVASIEKEIGCALPGNFMPDYVRGVGEEMKRSLQPLAGVHDALPLVRKSVSICVASNGERPNVMTALDVSGLKIHFPDEWIFTPEMVENPKPAPDMFLLAAERAGARPERTIVVEDSLTGTRAGKAAGMTVIGLTAAYHDKTGHARALREAGADHVTDQFIHIPGLMGL